MLLSRQNQISADVIFMLEQIAPTICRRTSFDVSNFSMSVLISRCCNVVKPTLPWRVILIRPRKILGKSSLASNVSVLQPYSVDGSAAYIKPLQHSTNTRCFTQFMIIRRFVICQGCRHWVVARSTRLAAYL